MLSFSGWLLATLVSCSSSRRFTATRSSIVSKEQKLDHLSRARRVQPCKIRYAKSHEDTDHFPRFLKSMSGIHPSDGKIILKYEHAFSTGWLEAGPSYLTGIACTAHQKHDMDGHSDGLPRLSKCNAQKK